MTKLFIPLICYNHQCNTEFMMSLMRLVMLLREQKLAAVIYPITFESLINRARNAAVAHFLSDPDATHLLFIDSDIEFDPVDVLRMLQADKQVIAAGYPQKWLSDQLLQEVFRRNPVPPSPLELCTKHSVHLKPMQPMQELMEATYATTGFLLIQRGVFDDMRRAYPQAQYKNDIDGYLGADPSMFYDFFPVSIHPETRRLESEDYGFCRLWTTLGGKIFVLTSVTLKHHGSFAYTGNMLRQLQTFIPAASPNSEGQPQPME